MATDPPEWVEQGKGAAKDSHNRAAKGQEKNEAREAAKDAKGPAKPPQPRLEMKGPRGAAVRRAAILERENARAAASQTRVGPEKKQEQTPEKREPGKQIERARKLKVANQFKNSSNSEDGKKI